METQYDIEQLFRKYLNRECTLSEINELLSYFEIDNNEALLKQLIAHYFNADSEAQETDLYTEVIAEVRDKLTYQIQEHNKPKKTIKLWPRIAIAAAVTVIIFSIGLFYNTNQKTKNVNTTVLINEIRSGKEGATLTLANGEKILINDALSGNIANQSGVSVSKSKDGQIVYKILDQKSVGLQYNTLTTTRGEQISVHLPDGSMVFLNAASSLKYPVSFAKLEKRQVVLMGEAYFEIAKDKLHPFIVTTDEQEVEVLGTHFNINSYSDEPATTTTLLEGSIRVAKGGLKRTLKPNQQASFIEGNFNIKNVNAADVISWKNGVFLFEDEKLESIMRRISRWYNVDVVYADGVNKNDLYNGGISKYDNVSAVLEMLESTKDIHFKIDGRRILVMN